MEIDPKNAWSDIQKIKKSSPLIHNITNYVVMESTANGLLAIGASPVMAHAVDEVEDMVKMAKSLVLNIGTLSAIWVQAMIAALKAANTAGIPVILDPVGVGATPYRTETVHTLLNEGKISAIRGNASEIASLSGSRSASKGVDSLLDPVDCQEQAKSLAQRNNCTVWMSGAVDLITNGYEGILVHNGDALMSRVTGMGCLATAITGAFLAVNRNNLQACSHAAIMLGIAGEIASKRCRGPGSFKLELIDALYNLSLDEIESHVRSEIL